MFDIVGLVKPSHRLADTRIMAELPAHLKQFAQLKGRENSVDIIFPPNGATVEVCPPGLVVKISGGIAPFRLVMNDKLAPKLYYERSFIIPVEDAGFYNLSVIDVRADVSSQGFMVIIKACQ